MADPKNVGMVDMDDILDARAEATEEAAPPEQTPPPKPGRKPEVHACGLPSLLMERKKLTEYLRLWGIEHKDRREMQYTNRERELYEIYSDALQAKRLSKEYFVAALRLWVHGFAMTRDSTIRLSELQVDTLE